MAEIRESDWKVLRSLKPIALERFCRRALEKIQSAASEASSTAHERYLLVIASLNGKTRSWVDCLTTSAVPMQCRDSSR